MAERVLNAWRSRRSESQQNLNQENRRVPTSNAPGGLFARTMGDGVNYAYEASPDDEDGQQSGSRDEARARADFMAVTRPPVYQRSVSDGFYCESATPNKATYVLLTPMSSGKRYAASSSFIDETSRDIEFAEELMARATGEDVNPREIPARRVFAPNRYEASRISDQRTSLQSQASDSQHGSDPSNSVRSSTLSNATTVSDEQRKNRVTLTPFLDDYYRNRATAVVANNPAPSSDRDNLVDNEAQADNRQSPQENPQENNPQEQGGAAPQENGCLATYYKRSNRIINSHFMFTIYLPLTFWSFYCIYEGLEYTKYCPATDTLPIVFVFLGLTSSFAFITRMFDLVVQKSAAYPTIANIIQCLQAVMFLGYVFIYILELASYLVLDLQRLPEVCAIEYYNFSHWNTWLQMPILAVMILLHAPSVYRSKWYCGTNERS